MPVASETSRTGQSISPRARRARRASLGRRDPLLGAGALGGSGLSARIGEPGAGVLAPRSRRVRGRPARPGSGAVAEGVGGRSLGRPDARISRARAAAIGPSPRAVGVGTLRTDHWRPQRDSKTTLHANHRRNPSSKRAKTARCARSQTTRIDRSRHSSGTVRGQSRDKSTARPTRLLVSCPHPVDLRHATGNLREPRLVVTWIDSARPRVPAAPDAGALLVSRAGRGATRGTGVGRRRGSCSA